MNINFELQGWKAVLVGTAVVSPWTIGVISIAKYLLQLCGVSV